MPVCSNCGASDFVWAESLRTGTIGRGGLSLRGGGELAIGTRVCRGCGHADLFVKDPTILRQPHTWKPGEFLPLPQRSAARPNEPPSAPPSLLLPTAPAAPSASLPTAVPPDPGPTPTAAIAAVTPEPAGVPPTAAPGARPEAPVGKTSKPGEGTEKAIPAAAREKKPVRRKVSKPKPATQPPLIQQ